MTQTMLSPAGSQTAQNVKTETLPTKLASRDVKEAPAQNHSTKAAVYYSRRPSAGEQLVFNVYSAEKEPSNVFLEAAEVEVHDLRPHLDEFSLEKNGFKLVRMEDPGTIDWQDKEQVEKIYYPLVENLIKGATNATRVHIFDHTLRQGYVPEVDKNGKQIDDEARKPGQPVGTTHVDYTVDSGIDRLSELLPEEAERLRKTPFAVIQIWKPLKGPVEASPLAIIDASTVAPSDLSVLKLNFPQRTGHVYTVHENQNHRWYFASQMQTDELYLFVCYGSDPTKARFVPHTGVKDLSVRDDAPPRESIELRSYVFWEDLPPQDVKRVL